MSSISVVRRNSVYSFLALGLRLAANMVLFVGIARFYGPLAFGQFSLAHVYFSIILLLADFGYDFYLASEIGRNTALTESLARQIMPVKMLLSLCSVVLMFALAWFGKSGGETRVLMMVLALGIPANTLMTYVAAIFRGNQNVFPETRTALTQNVLLLVLLVVIGIAGLPLTVVAIAFVVSRIYGFYVLWQQAQRAFPRLSLNMRWSSREEIKMLGGIGLTFGLHLIFATLYFQLDTILLDYLKGQEAVASYQAVMKLVALVLVLNEVTITAVIPVLAQSFETDRVRWMKHGQIVCKCLQLIGGFSGLLFILSPAEILSLTYGKGSFTESIPVMRIFGIILLIRFGMETYAMMLTTAKKQQLRTMVVILATMINVGANIVAIPHFGILGAAWVSLSTNIFIALSYVVLLSIQTRRSLLLIDTGQLIILGGLGIAGGILWSFEITSLVIVFPTILALTMGLIYVGFSKTEQDTLISFIGLKLNRVEAA